VWEAQEPAAAAPEERLDPARDFGAVYEAHYRAVFMAARGIVIDPQLAEDVTQDAFIKAYRARKRYRPTGSLEAWLCTIAAREAISRVRWSGVQRQLLSRFGRERLEPPEDLAGRLDEVLALLSPKVRAAVVLHFLHGYRYREIARMMRVPEGTVSSRLTEGLRQLRRHLGVTDESGPGPR
jgi:RNA polymerase sigma-70 factor (ECF subfamily)